MSAITGKIDGTPSGLRRVRKRQILRGHQKIAVGLTICTAILSRASHPQEHVRLMPQMGTGAITAVALSPDGRFVLTGSIHGSAMLWDAATGQQVRTFASHSEVIASVAFSPDGRFVLTGSWDKKARLWDVASGEQIRTFEGHSASVTSVSFSPNGSTVITGSWDKTARLWDAATGKQIRVLSGHTEKINAVAFSPDGRFALTGGGKHTPLTHADYTARLWDVSSGQEIRTFTGHSDPVNSVAFSPDGRYVLTGSGPSLISKDQDSTARLWDTGSGRLIRTFTGHTSVITSVAFSPDGRLVLTGSGGMFGNETDNTARIWSVDTGQQIRTLAGHTQGISSVAFSADGRSALSGSYDGTARLWNEATGEEIRIFKGYTNGVPSVAYSPDSRYMIFGSGNSAQLWDTAIGQQTRSFEGHTDWIGAVSSSPDSRSILTGSVDNTARLWDAETGKQISSFIGHSGAVRAVAFSPDGRFVLTASIDSTARLWNTATGKEIRSFDFQKEMVESVSFSPDGRYILTGNSHFLGNNAKTFRFVGTTRLWDASTGQQIRAFAEDRAVVTSVAFSPDGRNVLTGNDDGKTRIWDAASGRLTRSFEEQTLTGPAIFSPDGRFVVAGSSDGSVVMWNAATGEKICSFVGHLSPVDSLAFSPDGRFLLTGSADMTSRLWDVATGKHLATLLTSDKGAWVVTDPDGRYDSNDAENTPGLSWVTDNNRVIELKQLKDNYYTPNLLASIMKGERLPDVNGLDIVPAPPVVAVAAPYQPATRHLKLNILDQGGGIGSLVVSVNDRKAAVLQHPVPKLVDNRTRKTELTVDLSSATLKSGENTITAYAFDAGNQIRSHEAVSTFTVTVASKGLTAETHALSAEYRPQFYGVIVGTASFAGNHSMDLMYPAHDAASITTGLEIGASNLFGKENVHLRLLTTQAEEKSNQPTKANILAAFADVKKKAQPTDVLLVYLSGHGVSLRSEKDSYYYLTTDARSLAMESNPKLRQVSTISSAELRQWLGATNMPLKEVLILDTCAAGAANQELLKLVKKREVPSDQRRAVEFLKDATGTIVLMGSAADKASYEASKYGQGLLTYALLQGMRGRSVDAASQLNVSHWFQNASEDVPLLARTIGGIQKPVIAAPSGIGFPVALLKPADEARIPLAAIKPELLHLTCHNDDDEDPLGLAAVIRSQLREISHPSVRGYEMEPPVVYLDDSNEGPVDSLMPKVVYSMNGNIVSLRLRIDRAGKTLKEDRLNLTYANNNAVASAVTERLIDMAKRVPLEAEK